MAHENKGHRARLRARIMKEGLDGFQDHEVLEFLLFQFLPYKDTNKIAHNLLNSFGSFSEVINASPEQLMTVKGVSEVTACNLTILKEVFVRYRRADLNKVNLKDSGDIIKYARSLVEDNYCEKLVVVYLDHGTKYKFSEEFTSGKIDKVNVETKDIVSTAVRVNAAGVMLFHCHVNGLCQPSEADKEFTKQLFIALASIDVMLLEHVIFNGSDQFFSFYQEGLIQEISAKYRESF
ncbi:MAG: RadC family protein [Clostridiales bacterium]|nr:RadC family protein [Clostridiales bacterium]